MSKTYTTHREKGTFRKGLLVLVIPPFFRVALYFTNPFLFVYPAFWENFENSTSPFIKEGVVSNYEEH